MDAFESIVAIYLDSLGYWVKQSVKVDIAKSDKAKIGTPSMPTPEIDLVAYSPLRNELILVEVKSFLDSGGVELGGLEGTNNKTKKRYRLLNDPAYREIVAGQLKKSFIEKKFINSKTTFSYALAAGNVNEKDYDSVKKYLRKNRYYFFEPADIADKIKNLRNTVYLNDSVTITVKLLRAHYKE